MAEAYPKIVGHQLNDEEVVIVQVSDEHGFVANLRQKIRYRTKQLGAIANRGYWEGSEGTPDRLRRATELDQPPPPDYTPPPAA